MTGLSLLILLAGAVAIVLAVRFYLTGEVRVPGRPLLIGLRVAVLAIAILILLDVRLPGEDPGASTGTANAWLLLDSDLSLLLPSDAGGALWDRVLERVEAGAEAGTGVAVAARGTDGPEGIDPSALRERGPDPIGGDLLDGVLRLAEAGADSVAILSSLRRPPALLERLEAETPIPVRLDRFGEEVRNAGIRDLVLPAAVPEGEPVEGRVSLFGEGGVSGDSAVVEIGLDGVVIETLVLPLPAPGASAAADFVLPPVPDTGLVRYTARVRLDGDVFDADDLRAGWVRAGEAEGRVFLVSLRPDWEPRFLLPVLGFVTGLEPEGYLAVGNDRFLPLVAGGQGLRPLEAAEVHDRGEGAALLVIHGADGVIPEWVEALAREHPRVLHLPAGPGGAAFAGVSTDLPAPGEWTPDPEVPASPVAPFLSGLPIGGLPPLAAPFAPTDEAGGLVALRVRGAPGDGPIPVLLLREEEGLRRAVTLASGFWRWAARDGDGRSAYRSLWGGVTNWLLAPMTGPGGGAVRPVAMVQARGEPLRWHVPEGAAGARIELREAAGPETEVFRGPLEPGPDGIWTTPPVEPGIYRFEVRPGDAEDGPALAEGLVEVERWVGSLRLPPLDAPEGPIPPPAVAGPDPESAGRPLRTHPAPYLLALVLLCAEWIWRRRVGLR